MRTPIFSLLIVGALSAFACGGGGGSPPPAPKVKHGSSSEPPRAGSIVGNWLLQTIQVVRDTGNPHRLREGMNLRNSKDSVEVLLGEYIGPGSVLPTIMEKFFGGSLEILQVLIPEQGFQIQVILDYSPLFNVPKKTFYTSLDVRGELVGSWLEVDYLQREWVPVGNSVVEFERDELELVFVAGGIVPSVEGSWMVKDVVVLEDTRPKDAILIPVPIPRRIGKGDLLVNGSDRVLSLFGGPFTAEGFDLKFKNYELVFLQSFVGNGLAQGFMAFIGRGGAPTAKHGGVGDFNFFHTGDTLQGDVRMLWSEVRGVSVPHAYHVYLVLGPLSQSGMPEAVGFGDIPFYESPFLRKPEELELLLRASGKRVR